MEGKKGKWLTLLAAVVVLVAGVVVWNYREGRGELTSACVTMRSESMENGSFRWSFEADDTHGRPLETVFYTEEWIPVPEEESVDIVVRLYDSPAEGRAQLDRGIREDATGAEFVLTCVCPDVVSEQYPDASYRISFAGRNLGTWKLTPADPLADVEER